MHDPFQPPQQQPIPTARRPAGRGLSTPPPLPWMVPPPAYGPPARSDGMRGLMLAGLLAAYLVAVVAIGVACFFGVYFVMEIADPGFTTDATAAQIAARTTRRSAWRTCSTSAPRSACSRSRAPRCLTGRPTRSSA